MPRTIEQQIKSTYFALRIAAAAIGFAFPLLLWVGGKIAGFELQDSMSAYYWAIPGQPCPGGENPDESCTKTGSEVDLNLMPPTQASKRPPGTMRNCFVGLLFAIGMLLYINQGHSRREDLALNLAGLFAVGVAVFPMPWNDQKHSLSLHGICAISFFLCIAFVSAVCSRDTLNLIKNTNVRDTYRRTYVGLAVSMVVSPIAAYAFNFATEHRSGIFWAEFFGIYAFAAYWCVKTKEMSGPDIKRILAEKQEQALV
jgi:hypothetical membrane protein